MTQVFKCDVCQKTVESFALSIYLRPKGKEVRILHACKECEEQVYGLLNTKEAEFGYEGHRQRDSFR